MTNERPTQQPRPSGAWVTAGLFGILPLLIFFLLKLVLG